ncbi:HNH endonuclease [Nostoc sp. 'Peltigera membranacea cyanobiont' 210A]|uniref:HNH endonuclease n=1 Tax=Nostoc sp. 'Peltigera membranacea cyanobiont' 210A TaxID=2014529 RepID=UPI00167CB4D0|nr:HNH endonuclease [Nostoc sp. 'Peltigera membranacea cyanobiont' 210A]
MAERCKQIRNFYVSDENTLWITIFEKKLWWCFANTDITQRGDNTKDRAVIGKWNCNNILGESLKLEYFHEKLQKPNCNQTICCKEKYIQEILERINTREYQEIKNNIFEHEPHLANEREEVILQRIKRDQEIILEIKNKYNNCCQFENCGFTFAKTNGGFYSEAHHLILLSQEGSQDENNVVILCPNHHRMLHYAQVEIKDKENNKRLVKINGENYFLIYK